MSCYQSHDSCDLQRDFAQAVRNTAVRMWKLEYRRGHAVAGIGKWMKRRADIIGVDLDWRQKHVRRRTCLLSHF